MQERNLTLIRGNTEKNIKYITDDKQTAAGTEISEIKGRQLKTTGIAMALAAGICWGFSGACGQFMFDNKGMNSNWLVSVRLICAGTAILVYLLIKNPRAVIEPWKDKRDAADFIVFSVFGMTLCQYSYFMAIQHSNAGVATVLQYMGPALILVYVCLRTKRRPKLYETAALILSLGGTFILATHGDIASMALSKEALFWGIMAAVTLAVYSVHPERIVNKYGSLLPIGWAMFIGGIIMNIIFKPWNIEGVIVDGGTLLGLAGVILLGTILGFSLYLKGVQIIGAADAAMISCIEPVSAVAFSVLWLGERFMLIDILGMVLTIGAVFVISFFKGRSIKE